MIASRTVTVRRLPTPRDRQDRPGRLRARPAYDPAVPTTQSRRATPVAGSVAWWVDLGARLERRRPRAEGLTLERIVDEAIRLVDDEGLDALTVRGLAARFHTGSATLYRHVASREELLVLIVDRVLGEVEAPPSGRSPRAQVEHLAGGLRRVLLRHPNLVRARPAAPLQGPNAIRGSELSLAALQAAGYPAEVAAAAYLALLDYVLGSVFFDSARLDRHGADAPDDRTADDDHPALVASAEALADLGSDAAFEFGLATFLDGLERLRR